VVCGTTACDNLSSYFLFGTHSNRAYLGNKLITKMGMDGIFARKMAHSGAMVDELE